MKISLNWLSDYVDVNTDPMELAAILTRAGIEVEEINSSATVPAGVVVEEGKTELKLLLATFLNKLITLSPIKNALCVGKSSFYIQDVLQFIAEHYADAIEKLL